LTRAVSAGALARTRIEDHVDGDAEQGVVAHLADPDVVRGGTGDDFDGSETQTGDLDDVDKLAAHDDLIREHAAGDDDVAAPRVDPLMSPTADG